MADSPNTLIPYVPEGTLDPAAGLNDAIDVIDALLQLSILGIQDAPPGSPADGDLYLVGTGSGAWAGEDDNLARYRSEGTFWQFFEAGTQVRVLFNAADQRIYVWTGSDGWQQWPVLASLENAADDAAAAVAGVAVGELYRNGSVLQIRVA